MPPATPPREPTSRFLTANGLRHHVLEWDGGGRTTFLLLHGFLDLAWNWSEVAPVLAAAGHHVLAPDLRGHGDTDRVGAGGYYHFMDYLFDVADLVDALARERLVLVGHSMGGSISAVYAGAFPERPAGVVVLEGIHMEEKPAEDPARRAAEWVRAVRKARSRRPRVYPSVQMAAERLRQMDPRCPPDLALLLAEKGTRQTEIGARVFKHDPVQMTRGPYPFQLARMKGFWAAIRCPVLLVEGSDTELPPPPDMDERVLVFPRARRAVIPGAGHQMVRHRPAEVARLALELADQAWSGGSTSS